MVEDVTVTVTVAPLAVFIVKVSFAASIEATVPTGLSAVAAGRAPSR